MGKNNQQLGKEAKSKVESELKKRGYTVLEARTELSVKSPRGKVFRVKIGSLSSANAWIIDSPQGENRYFVLVFQPGDKPPEFFILTADEMQREKENHLRKMKKPLNEYSAPELEKKGLGFKQPEPYKDNWSSLPK